MFYTVDYQGKIPHDVHAYAVSETELERISGLISPNKILALVKYPPRFIPDWKNEQLVLVLDEVRDPGNLGTILRTADWFGVKTVIASETSVDLYNPKVIQASMGAVFRINYLQDNLINVMSELQEHSFKIYGADLKGKDLYQVELAAHSAIVMGSESHGLTPGVKQMLSEIVTIPRFGKTESLNVAMAAGIILSHFRSKVI
ncbi:MAG: RNA methyltransferase [Crocinitomicaceae bacterium]|nr:RNA methyltransferase [Crocinitomicaceae bacterium]MBK8926098.1 RNA methyltransferase [Crocinitomicaceae bacterium]